MLSAGRCRKPRGVGRGLPVAGWGRRCDGPVSERLNCRHLSVPESGPRTNGCAADQGPDVELTPPGYVRLQFTFRTVHHWSKLFTLKAQSRAEPPCSRYARYHIHELRCVVLITPRHAVRISSSSTARCRAVTMASELTPGPPDRRHRDGNGVRTGVESSPVRS
jgi:hypothetical protein